jgi:hypothetical protein
MGAIQVTSSRKGAKSRKHDLKSRSTRTKAQTRVDRMRNAIQSDMHRSRIITWGPLRTIGLTHDARKNRCPEMILVGEDVGHYDAALMMPIAMPTSPADCVISPQEGSC